MTSTTMTPEQRAAFEAWQRQQGYAQPQPQPGPQGNPGQPWQAAGQLPSSLAPGYQQAQQQWQGQPQQQPFQPQQAGGIVQQQAPQPVQAQYGNPGQQFQPQQQPTQQSWQTAQPQHMMQGQPQGNPQQQWQGQPQGQPQQQWQGQPQGQYQGQGNPQQQWQGQQGQQGQVQPAMDQAQLIAQMRRDMQGIGAQALAAEKLLPPLPAKVTRDMTLPPERNIVSSYESMSLVRLTDGKVRQTFPKPGEYSKTFYQVKGTLLSTTGDTPVNSEVGFAAWPGFYYKRDMKGIVVSVCQLRGADAQNEDLIMSKIEEIFIRSPSTAIGKIVGCKSYVGLNKAGTKQGFRWLLFPVVIAPDGSYQPMV